MGEAIRAEHDPNGEEEANEDTSDDDVYIDRSDPKPAPPHTEIPESQFSQGRSDVPCLSSTSWQPESVIVMCICSVCSSTNSASTDVIE